MTGTRLAGRVALVALALSLMLFAVEVGVGQGQTTTAPSQLTQEYPLGKEKLARGERSAGASDRNGPDDGNSLLWLLLLAPVAVLVLLVWLVAYARSSPPTAAYGYALGNEQRQRRHVPAVVIRLLTPLFAYNHHRDAYVLREIGHRRGPVLKLRSSAEDLPAPRPATARTAAAPLGARGDAMPARLVREPARAAAKADPPVKPDTPAPEPKPQRKPAKAEAATKPKTAKTAKAGKNGKSKKTSAAPKATKAKGSTPALTDALSAGGKSNT